MAICDYLEGTSPGSKESPVPRTSPYESQGSPPWVLAAVAAVFVSGVASGVALTALAALRARPSDRTAAAVATTVPEGTVAGPPAQAPGGVPGGMPLRTFKATMPRVPTRLTASLSLSSAYLYDFRGARETHHAVRMKGEEGGTLYGYAPKDSDAGRALFEALKDGREHRLTVTARYAGPGPHAALVTGVE
jgi:hypothetical protein